MVKNTRKILVVLLCLIAISLKAQQPMETEEANLLPAKTLEVSATYEYQTSEGGQESALPFGFAYGITNDLEFMIEPVPYTKIVSPNHTNVIGAGDIEATLTYRFLNEINSILSFAAAGEVKFPTAKNNLIGTGKTDYTFYLIATKSFGKFENHLNVGYSIIGQPAGIELNNVFNFAAAIEYHFNNIFDIVGEVLANTSTLPQTEQFGAENSNSPELSGGEVVGMLGMRYYLNPKLFLALGITYDNNNAVLFRPGITFFF